MDNDLGLKMPNKYLWHFLEGLPTLQPINPIWVNKILLLELGDRRLTFEACAGVPVRRHSSRVRSEFLERVTRCSDKDDGPLKHGWLYRDAPAGMVLNAQAMVIFYSSSKGSTRLSIQLTSCFPTSTRENSVPELK